MTYEDINNGYDKLGEIDDSRDAAARICAQHLLNGNIDAAHRFAERFRMHTRNADELRARLTEAMNEVRDEDLAATP